MSLKTPKPKEAKRKAHTNISKASFLNRPIELINVPHIFHDPSVKAYLPIDIKFDDPAVVYSLANLIRSKIFDFNKCVSNLDVIFQDKTIFPYNSAFYDFIDKDH